MIIEILKSFACGIAFVAGMTLSALVLWRAQRKDVKAARAANERCEARLTESLEQHKRIADVLEWWQKRQTDSEFHGEKR